jgi:hypothetical protein
MEADADRRRNCLRWVVLRAGALALVAAAGAFLLGVRAERATAQYPLPTPGVTLPQTLAQIEAEASAIVAGQQSDLDAQKAAVDLTRLVYQLPGLTYLAPSALDLEVQMQQQADQLVTDMGAGDRTQAQRDASALLRNLTLLRGKLAEAASGSTY